MARAAALLLPLLLAGTWVCTWTRAAPLDATCPDACVCFHDARLWVAHPREDSLTARCVRRGLEDLPRGLGGDLRHLDASGNALVALREDEFAARGLELLLSVDLSGNAIAEVQVGAFRGLNDLRRVFLAHNRITTLPEDLFSDCTQLWFLSLAGNPLIIPDASSNQVMISVPSLKVLDVSDCKLSFFPDHVLGHDNSLKELVVANNSIPEVHVKHLKHLQRLDVSDNRLRGLTTESISVVKHLRTVMLDGNPLRADANGKHPLPGSPTLRLLSAANCGLRHVDTGMFAELPNIEELTLDANGIADLPVDVFSTLPHLRRLSLRHNRLPALAPGVFANNTELRALDLSGNPLQEALLVPESTETPTPWLVAPALRELSMAHCGLRALPAALFAGVPALRNLSAAHNVLHTLSAQVVAALPRLRALDLTGNMLRCDAALRPAWLACEAQHVRVSAACFDPPGDWQMLRYVTGEDGSARLEETTAKSAHVEEPRDPEEDDDEGIAEELVKYGVRWGPVLGGFLLVVVFILVLRKWMDHMSIKRYHYRTKSEEYVYESEEDEGTTTTMMTDSGSPCISPSDSASSPPSSPNAQPASISPPAAKRLADAGKNDATPPLLPRFTVSPAVAESPRLSAVITTPPVRHSRI